MCPPTFYFSGAPLRWRWASASGRCRADSPIAGRVGEKHLFFRITAILFGGFRGLRPRTLFRGASPAPHPGSLFVRTKSDQKAAQGRDPFDGVPPLWIPPPRRHKGGRMPPFGYPRRGGNLSFIQYPLLYPHHDPFFEIVVRIYCLGQFHPNTNRSSCHTCFG